MSNKKGRKVEETFRPTHTHKKGIVIYSPYTYSE